METGRLSNRPQPDPALAAASAPRPAITQQSISPAPQPGTATPPAQQAAVPARAQQQPSREAVEQLVEQVQRKVQVKRHSLSFEVNEDAGLTVVSVIDRETSEVIRQIPSEEMVRLAEFFAEIETAREADANGATGLLLREQA